MLSPGTYTYPFQYQLPEGVPGSFVERTPLQLDGEEMIDDNHVSPQDWYDSDDEYGGYKSQGPHTYQRSALLAVIMYKLKASSLSTFAGSAVA